MNLEDAATEDRARCSSTSRRVHNLIKQIYTGKCFPSKDPHKPASQPPRQVDIAVIDTRGRQTPAARSSAHAHAQSGLTCSSCSSSLYTSHSSSSSSSSRRASADCNMHRAGALRVKRRQATSLTYTCRKGGGTCRVKYHSRSNLGFDSMQEITFASLAIKGATQANLSQNLDLNKTNPARLGRGKTIEI